MLNHESIGALRKTAVGFPRPAGFLASPVLKRYLLPFAFLRTATMRKVTGTFLAIGIMSPVLGAIETPTSVVFDEITAGTITASAYVATPGFTGLGGAVAGTNIAKDGTYAGWHVYGDSWTVKAAMPTARYYLAAAAVGGKLYAVGGYDTGYLTKNEEYDPVSNTWLTKAVMPTGRAYLAAAAVGDKLYALGGYNAGGGLGVNQEYDPAANIWLTKAVMPTARYYLAAAAIGGKLYAVGGSGVTQNENEEYDPVVNTWAIKAVMPTARNELAAAAIGGKLYVVGGYLKNTNEEYDPAANTWATKAGMSLARYALAAAAAGGKLYAVGGTGPLNKNEVYDATANTWAIKAVMPTARERLAAVAIGGKLYAVGGSNGSNLNTNESYDPGVATVFGGLAPNTQYSFKAMARDSAGVETGESATVSTYTLAYVSGPASYPAIYSSTITVAWSSGTVSGGYNGANTTYLVQASTSSDFVPVAGSSTTALPYAEIGGLSPQTTYYFRVKAANAVNVWTDYAVIGSTLSGIETPTNIIFDEVTAGTITASAYVATPGFTKLNQGLSATNIAKDGSYAGWHVYGDSWTIKAVMPTARFGLSAAAVGGKLYAVGGFDTANSSKNEEYDPVVNTWETKAAMPTARRYLSFGVIGGKLYAVGGLGPSNANEEYNPESNTWTIKAAMPTTRDGLAAAAVGGKLYALGGVGPLNTNEEYDPAADAWVAKAVMPTARGYLAAAVVSGKVYAVGGLGGTQKENEEYDPAADAWVVKAVMPTARRLFAAAAINGKIYAVGGYNGSNLNVNEEYDPTTNTWAEKVTMPTMRGYLAGAAIGGRLYAVGGDNGPTLNVNEAYDPGVTTVFGGLAPNTQYSFRAKARNANGAETGESITVSTYTLAHVGSPATFPAIYASSITVAWSSGTAANGYNGANTTYFVQASSNSNFATIAGSSQTTGQNYATVTGITLPTTYYFRVKAANAVNVWSDYVTVGSRFCAIERPINIVFDEITAGTITASAYVATPGFTGLGGAVAGTNIAKDGAYAGWHVYGDSWTVKVAMPTPRFHLAAAAVGGKLYAVGGSGATLKENEEYDPVANTWATKAVMPTAREYLAAVAVGGKLYALGGIGPLNTNEAYDPVTDTWATKAVMPTARHGLCAVVIGGKLYAVGGTNGPTLNEEYDPAANTWATKAEMPTARNYLGAAAIGGKLYVVGGYNGPILDINQEYDPAANTWATKAVMPTARYDLSAAAVGGKLYAVGGTNGSGLNVNQEYDPAVNTWVTKTVMPTARYGLAAAAVGGKLYAVGGDQNKNEAYDPGVATVFGGLAPNMQYSFKAMARDSSGVETGESATISTYTLAYAAGPASYLAIYASTITVAWSSGTVSGGYNGANTTYLVQASSNSDFIPVIGSSTTALPYAEIGGLSPQTTYYFRVKAANAVNVWTDYAVLGSTISAIETPTNIIFDEVTSGTITASAYAATPGFTGLGTGLSATNIAKDGAYSGWHTGGNTWTAKAVMPTARHGLAAAVIGGKLYAVGGISQLNTNQEYDPAANTWATKAVMPTGRQYLAAAAVGGRLYAVGGYTTSASNKNEEYDPVANTWAAKAVMPTGRYVLAAAAIGGKVYAVGGYDTADSNKNEEYNPASNTWEAKAVMPAVREQFAVAVAGGKFYAVGGYGPLDTNEEYDPAANTWAAKAAMPTARQYPAAASVGGKVYVVGGVATLNTNEEYDPAANTWATKAVMSAARGYLSAAAINGKLYAVGGSDGSAMNTNEAYDPGVATAFGGLAPNTQYSFKAKARNLLGVETGESVTVSTYTLAYAGEPATYSDISYSNITVAWSSGTASGGYNASGARYDVQASTRADFVPVWGSSNTAEISAAISGLADERLYYFRVRGINTPGAAGDYAALGSTYTAAILPANVQWVYVSSTQARVSWELDTPATEAPWMAISTAPDFNVTLSSAIGSVGQQTVTYSVLDNTSYYFKVKVSTKSDMAYCSPISTRTAAPIPSNIIFDEVTVGTITASAYVATPGFSNLEQGQSAINIAKDGAYAGWHSSTWTIKAAMPTARYLFGMAVIGGKLYAVGGHNGSTYINTNEEYDPVFDTWTTKAVMPTVRAMLAAAAIGGKLYAVGGYNAVSLNTNEEYDPITNTWAIKAVMPTARYDLAAAAIGGKLYAVGGDNGVNLDKNEEYNPTSNTWATKAVMPTARRMLAAAITQEKLYVLGGRSNAVYYSSTNEEYNPLSNTWATKAAMPTGRYRLAAAGVGGKLYVVGGEGGIRNENEEYDPAANTWAIRAAMPTARDMLAAAAIAGKVYTVGGGYVTFKENEVYDPGVTTVFGGLAPSTQYSFKAKARNSAGIENGESVTVSTYTLAYFSGPASYPAVYSSSITVAWSSGTAAGGFNGPNTTYLAQASLVSNFGSIAGSSTTALPYATISGLSAQTTYYFRVKAANAVNVWTDYAVLGSTISAIETPTNIIFDEVTAGTITASAYAATPGFTGLGTGLSATNIAKDGAYAGWHGSTWTVKAVKPSPRGYPGSASVGGKIYVVGGDAGTGQNTNEEFDPAANTWAVKAVMPTARYRLTAVAIGDKLYAVGGYTSSPVNLIEAYDPATNTWETKVPMPTARHSVGSVSIGGKMYVVGGLGGTQKENEVYDPAANTWITKTAMPTARYGLATAAIGGKMYVVGGNGPLNTNEEYDPATDTWATKAVMPTARIDLAAVQVGGKLFAVGGNNGAYLGTNEEYDPLANTWATRTVMPTARSSFASAVVAGKIYVVTGNDGASYLGANEVYDPGVAAVFGGLAPNTQYSFKAKARGINGAETGESVTISTYTLAHAGAPASFPAIYISSITVGWSSGTVANGYNGPNTTYLVQASSVSTFIPIIGSSTTALPYAEIVGLSPQTTYYFRVKAANAVNVWGDYVVIGSTMSAIETPTNIVFDEVTAGTITASAYAATPGFTKLNQGLSATNIAKDGTYAGWHIYGDSWTVKAVMPTARYDLAVAVVGGKLYAVGGYGPLNKNEEYDPAANTWAIKAVMPTARYALAAAAIGGKLYAVGGNNGVSYMGTNEEYDPVVNIWVTKAVMPTARTGLATVALGGKLYAVGGNNGSNLNTNEEYDPAVNTWGSKTAMPTPRRYFAAAAVGGKLYALGGDDGTGLVNEEYNPAANTWGTKAAMPTTHSYFAAPAIGGKLYAVGADTEEYDPAANTWAIKAANPTVWFRFAAASVGGKLYALGGATGGQNQNESYDPGVAAVFGGLAPNTQYSFKAKARGINGAETGESVAVSTYTLAVASGPATFPAVNDGSITVAWSSGSASIGFNGPGATYFVQASSSSNFAAIAGSAQTADLSAAISGITLPQTTYYFRVKAANAVNVWTDYAVIGSTLSGIETPTNIVFDEISTAAITASAYAATPGFTKLNQGLSATNIAKDGTYAGWHVYGDSWTVKAVMPTARAQLAVAVIGGKLYAIGGDNAGYKNTNEEYDPAANTWVSKTVMPTARYGMAVAAIDGKLYAVGGYDGSFKNINEAYDPVANTWAAKAVMPTAREGFGAAAIGGKLYAIGGSNGSDLNVNQEYDPAANTWAAKAAMPTARMSLAAAAISGKVYAVGGNNGGYLNTNEVYDPVSNTWAAKAVMPTARAYLAAAAVGGKLYAVGGGNGPNLNVNEEYDPTANTWAVRTVLPTARYGLGAALVGGKLYAVGGSNINEAYDPGVATVFGGLAPNTQYSFKAKARNVNGAETGESVTVSTYTLAVATVSASGITFVQNEWNHVRVQWSSGTSAGGFNGSGARYDVQASTNNAFIPVWGSSNTAGLTADLTGLSAEKLYYFRVRGLNTLGVSGDYTPLGSTTTAMKLPSNVQWVYVSSTLARVSWELDTPATEAPWMVISTVPDFSVTVSSAMGSVGQQTATYSVLDNTSYYFKVKVSTDSDTYYSAVISTRTAAPIPSNIVFDEVSTAAITASAYAPVFANLEQGQSGVNVAKDGAYAGWHTGGNVWAGKTAMSAARYYLAAAAVGGKIYGVGGYVSGASAANEEYDPVANVWSAKAAMPTARWALSAASSGGKLYAVGGWSGSAALNNNEAYDPAANTWSAKAAMPTAREALAAISAGGKLYATGGDDGALKLSANEAYDPVTDTWAAKADMPAARVLHAGAEIGGKVYWIGGRDAGGGICALNEEYDPASNGWIAKTAMPTARNLLAAAAIGGKIYVVGGDNGSVVSKNEEYDPVTNSWATKSPISTARAYLAAAVVDGKLYAIGGRDGGGSPLAANEAYDPGVTSVFGGLTPNTQYAFKAKARNYGGYESSESVTVSTYTLAMATAPASFTAAYADALTFAWSSGSAQGGYNGPGALYLVQLSSAPGFGIIAASSQTYNAYATLSGLSANITYYARVKAANNLGVWTDYSVLGATPTLSAAPASTVFNQVWASSASVGWSGSGNSAGTSYVAELSTSSDFNAAILSSTTLAVSAVITSLTPDSSYYFRIKAVNASGVATSTAMPAGPALTLAEIPGDPLTPYDVYASSLTLRWDVKTNPGYTQYRVQRSARDDVGFGVVDVDTSWQVGISSRVFDTLQTNATYYFRIKARNQANIESPAGASWYVLPSTQTRSNAPVGVTPEIYSSSITAKWNMNNAAGVQYLSELSAQSDFSVILASSSWRVDITSQSYTGLDPNARYYIRVRARNSSYVETGNVPLYSEYTRAAPPGGPLGQYTRTANSVQVNWSKSGNPDGTEYLVQRSSSSDYVYDTADSGWTTINSYNFTVLSAATTYYFRAKARNYNAAPLETGWAVLPSTETMPGVAAPSGLTIGYPDAVSGYKLDLSWTDNSNDELGFRVYQNEGLIATLGADAVSYPAVSLSTNSYYSYRVSAYNALGESYSNMADKHTRAIKPAAAVFNNVDVSALRVDWTAPDNPAATQYFCELSTTSGFNLTTVSTQAMYAVNYATFTGLSPNTTYYARVIARNGSYVYTDYTYAGSTRTVPLIISALVTDTPHTTIVQGQKLSYAKLTLTPNGAGALWSGLTVRRQGTGSDADLSRVAVHRDGNSNGAYEAGNDPEISGAWGVFAASEAALTLNETLNSAATYFVTLTCADNYLSWPGNSVGITITSTASLASPNSIYTLNTQPFSSSLSTITKLADTLDVTWLNQAPSPNVSRGTDNLAFLRLTLAAARDRVYLNSLTLDKLGTLADAYVPYVKVYRDDNQNGTLDAGSGDSLVSSGVDGFSSGQAVINLAASSTRTVISDVYFVALDLAANAPLGATVGVRVQSAGSFAVMAGMPDVVSMSVSPADSGLPSVSDPPNTLLVTGTDLGVTTVEQGALRALEKLELTSDSGSALWSLLKVQRSSSSADADYASISLYRDNAPLGAFDPATDTRVASGTFSAGLVTWSLSETILNTSTKTYFIAAGISPSANTSAQAGVKLQTGYIDAASDATAIGAVFPMISSFAQITATVDTIVVTPDVSVAPASAYQSAVNVPVLALKMFTDRNGGSVSGVNITQAGSAQDGDIAALKIYLDDGDNVLDASSDTLVSGNYAFSAGTASVSFNTLQSITVSSSVYFIAAEIAAAAVPGRTLGARVSGASAFSVIAPDTLTSTFPITGNLITLEKAPAVVLISTSSTAPASAQPGTQDILMERLGDQIARYRAVMNSVSLVRNGGADSYISGVALYLDANGDALPAAGELVSSGVFSGGALTLPFTGASGALTTESKVYLVTMGIAASAPPGAYLGLNFQSIALGGSGDSIEPGRLPFASPSVQVSEPPNNLLVTAVDQGVLTVEQGTTHALERLDLTADIGSAVWNLLKVQRSTTSLDADYSSVSLYRDNAPLGVFDTGTDVRVASGVFSSGLVTWSLSESILNTSTKTYFIVVGIAPNANTSSLARVGLQSGYITAAGANTTVAAQYPIYSSLAAITPTIDVVVVTPDVTAGAAAAYQAAVNVPVLALKMFTNRNAAELSAVTLYEAGTAQDADISAVKLFRDDGNGTFNAAADTLVSGNYAFSGGTATVSFNTLQSVDVSSSIYFIAADVAGAAVPGRTLRVGINGTSDFSVLAPDLLTSTFPIISNEVTLEKVTASVLVSTLSLAPASAQAGAQGILMERLQLRTNQSTALMNSVSLVRAGGLDADVSRVALYWDVNVNGVMDSGELVSSGVFSGGSVSLPVTGAARELSVSSKTYYAVIDLSPSAVVNDTLALTFTAISLAAPDGIEAGRLPFTSGSVAVAEPPSALVPAFESRLNSQVTQGDVSALVAVATISATAFSVNWNRLDALLTGTCTDACVSALNLYRDDGNGAWGGPAQEIFVSSGVFTAGLSSLNLAGQTVTYPQTKLYYISADISASATLGATFGISLPAASYLGVSAPDTVSSPAGVFAFNSAQAVIDATVDTLEIAHTDLAPAVKQGDVSKAIGRLTLHALSNSAELAGVRFDKTGTAVDADITGIRLYYDSNADGAFQAGDTLAASASGLSNGAVNLLVSPPQSVGTADKSYFVVVDLSSQATVGATLGLTASAGYFSVVAPDLVALAVSPVSFSIAGVISDSSDTVKLAFTDLASTSLYQGRTNSAMAKLRLWTTQDSAELTGLKLSLNGSAALSDLGTVKLYRDTDGNGVFSADSDSLAASGNFASSLLTLTLSAPGALGAAPADYFLTLDIAASAVIGGTAGLVISDESGILLAGSDKAEAFSALATTVGTIRDPRVPTPPVLQLYKANGELFGAEAAAYNAYKSRMRFNWESTVMTGSLEQVYYYVGGAPANGATPAADWKSGGLSRDVWGTGLELLQAGGYYLCVRTKNSLGDYYSDIVCRQFTVDSMIPQLAGVSAAREAETVILNWDPASAGPSGVTYYRVEERKADSPVWTQISISDSRTIIIGNGPSGVSRAAARFKTAAVISRVPGTYYYRITPVSGAGLEGTPTEPLKVDLLLAALAAVSDLSVYPNPFDSRKGVATIHFQLNSAGAASLKIYDIYGRKVRSLDSAADTVHDMKWDGADSSGKKVSKGIYIGVLETGGTTEKLKIGVIH